MVVEKSSLHFDHVKLSLLLSGIEVALAKVRMVRMWLVNGHEAAPDHVLGFQRSRHHWQQTPNLGSRLIAIWPCSKRVLFQPCLSACRRLRN